MPRSGRMNPASAQSGARFGSGNPSVATPAPTPLDALRQHTQAVVLTAPDGEVSPQLMAAIRDSGVPCELIGHPLVAMAELARLERDLRGAGSGERTALVVSDRDQWDDLSLLFEVVRERLSRVSIWILAGQLAIEVHRGRASEHAARPSEPAAPIERSFAPMTARTPPGKPNLRIVEPHDAPPRDAPALRDGDDAEPLDENADTRSAEAVTSAEIEMLLDLFDGPEGEGRGGAP